jgi:hypothetical protein
MILDLLNRGAIIRAVISDGAFRGIHICKLLRAGIVPVVPMHGSDKPQPLREHVCTSCGTIYDLWTQDGAVAVHDITDDGQTFVQLLPIIKIEPRANKDSWRWSLLLRLPCGHEVRERLDTTDDDTARGFNRSEHLRALSTPADELPPAQQCSPGRSEPVARTRYPDVGRRAS